MKILIFKLAQLTLSVLMAYVSNLLLLDNGFLGIIMLS